MKKKELAERIAAIEKHLGITTDIKIGTWYFCPCKMLACVTYFDYVENDTNKIRAYGFDCDGKWQQDDGSFSWGLNVRKEATPEEVKLALIEEAKRRGHKPWDCLEGFWYDCSLNVLYDRFGIHKKVVFQNGKWAEIIEQPKSILDGNQKEIFLEYPSITINVHKNGFDAQSKIDGRLFTFENEDIDAILDAQKQLKGGDNA